MKPRPGQPYGDDTQFAADSAFAPREDVTQEDVLKGHVREAGRLMRWGGLVLGLGLLPLLAWLIWAPLSAAVVATAFVKVDLDKRPVQHAEGGTVREVLVRDGQRVKAGDTLLVLGDVAVAADVNRVDFRVMTEQAGFARLEAEQLGAPSIRFSQALLDAAASDPRLAEQLTKERALFAARREALTGQVELMRAQQAQIRREIELLTRQVSQASEALRLQRQDLDNQRNLQKEGFVSVQRITQTEAAVADYAVKLSEKESDVARAAQRVVELDLRIKTLEGEYRQQASDLLKVNGTRLAELQQEQRKTTDAAKRQTITAPVDGDVVNLRFTSPGAMVSPREPIADIVPANPRLVIEAHVRPEDIGQVTQGQRADIRFTAFQYRSTPLVQGTVIYKAPDRTVDRNTGLPFFVVLIEAPAQAVKAAGDITLQPGMPAEVYIRGVERRAIQYLVEPITQVLRRAGREP
ncbi:MAG: HlyD family type I secretion periplasmic adaptor subunit [Rubrivivax sp.]|nr:HlyD family type I secretion periplasmic adaptor subunit [Rubrivivax sp.]